MSRHHDSNIDPFNAGEPVMPEDTQPDDFPGDACSFADKDYSAPRKRPDAYRAPTDNSPASVADNNSSIADKRAHRAWKAAFKTRDGKTNQKPRASNHTKSSSPKITGRRSKLAIFILIVFILVVAGNLLDSTLFDESPFASFEETFSTHDDDTFDHSQARELDPSELDEEESTVYDVTCQTLSALQDNEDVRERICNNLSQELKNSYGYDVEDLGIDPTIYANKLLGNFTYKIESVYAFTNNEDPADNRGTAFFDYFVPSAYDFDETFHEELSEYLYDEGLSSAHGQLTDAQKERVREIYNDALNEIENDDTESSYGSLEFSYDGASNTFGLKEQSFNELVDSAFQLF